MKRKHLIILFLSIFLIAEAIFFLNMLEPTVPVILASLLAAALISAAWSSVVYLLVYLLNKRSANRA
jgi:hypothetical protein